MSRQQFFFLFISFFCLHNKPIKKTSISCLMSWNFAIKPPDKNKIRERQIKKINEEYFFLSRPHHRGIINYGDFGRGCIRLLRNGATLVIEQTLDTSNKHWHRLELTHHWKWNGKSESHQIHRRRSLDAFNETWKEIRWTERRRSCACTHVAQFIFIEWYKFDASICWRYIWLWTGLVSNRIAKFRFQFFFLCDF